MSTRTLDQEPLTSTVIRGGGLLDRSRKAVRAAANAAANTPLARGNQKEIRELHQLSDHILNDIGVTRGDVDELLQRRRKGQTNRGRSAGLWPNLVLALASLMTFSATEVTAGAGGVSGDGARPDNIILDIANGVSGGGFGHPECINTGDPSELPAVN